MKGLRRFIVPALAALWLAGCQSTGTAYNPPSGAGADILIVGDCGSTDCTAGGTGNILQFNAPFTAAPTVLQNEGPNAEPWAMTFDSSGNLWVANSYYANTVTEYAPPYTGAPKTTVSNGVDVAEGVAFNSSGDLFVANWPANDVTEYAAPYTGAPIATITNGVSGPEGVAVDSHGNLYVANYNNLPDSVTEYAPPYTGAPVTTITTGIAGPMGLAFNTSNDLFVTNNSGGPGNVVMFAPPYTGTPTTITNGIDGPWGDTVDSSNNLFVANYDNNTVTEYAPPYTGAPSATITSATDMGEPNGVAVRR